MEKEPAITQASSGERRQCWLAAWVVLLMLAGWVGYVCTLEKASVMKLPDGSTLSFVGVSEGLYTGKTATGEDCYNHAFVPRGSLLDVLRESLPTDTPWLANTGENHRRQRSQTRTSRSSKNLWFSVEGPFESSEWNIYWVDELGNETLPHYNGSITYEGFDGHLSSSQEYLHLRIRKRDKKSRLPGDVAAEMKFRNPWWNK